MNSSWDFYIDPNHSEADLSKDKITTFANRIRLNNGIQQVRLSDVDILNKMEFLRNGRVTFGAYLLFVKDDCLISDVQVGRFKSDTIIIDSLSFNSDLFQEVDDILAFIKRHLKVEYIITGEPQRTERFDYPLDAIREIVVNMIAHRDYRDSSASIVKIFDNRIEFFNPGKLYGGISVQDLLSGNYTSKSRNKLIARAFKEMGIIERYGSGIMRVCKICNEYGIKAPDFQEVFNGFQVIIYNEKVVATDVIEKGTVNGVDVIEKGTDVIEKGTVNGVDVIEKGTDVIEEILKTITENNQITALEIAKRIHVTQRTVLRNIEKLKNENVIERIGPDKGGYWKINYLPEHILADVTEGITIPLGVDSITNNQSLIIQKMANNPLITVSELSSTVGISPGKIKVNISKLKAKGLIERVGSEKGGHWKVTKR